MHEVKPKAEFIGGDSYISNIMRIYSGYRRCYSDVEGRVSNSGVNLSDAESFIRRMLKAEHAHESPLEHASLTWHITCSRACSHQLVRHRIASYSQQSQRYVRMDDLPVVIPQTYKDTGAESLVLSQLELWERNYKLDLEYGIPAEDARYLLPNCVATQVVVTMNFRVLLHFFAERTCNRAQWEIRDIANQMLGQCKTLYPCVFENAGPHCMKLRHCPEAKPCGSQPWKRED